jgi:hypothetical protein
MVTVGVPLDASTAPAAAAEAAAEAAANEAGGASFLNHSCDVGDLRPGDHIYCYKWQWNAVPFQHHGIVLEVDVPDSAAPLGVFVAHFAWSGVERLSLEDFLNCNGKQSVLRRAQYSENIFNFMVKVGASYMENPLPLQESLALARQALLIGEGITEWASYHMLANNCEAFACFCKTGKKPAVSRQVVRGAIGLAAVGGASAINAGLATSAVVAAARAKSTRVVLKSASTLVAGMVVDMVVTEVKNQIYGRFNSKAPASGSAVQNIGAVGTASA